MSLKGASSNGRNGGTIVCEPKKPTLKGINFLSLQTDQAPLNLDLVGLRYYQW